MRICITRGSSHVTHDSWVIMNGFTRWITQIYLFFFINAIQCSSLSNYAIHSDLQLTVDALYTYRWLLAQFGSMSYWWQKTEDMAQNDSPSLADPLGVNCHDILRRKRNGVLYVFECEIPSRKWIDYKLRITNHVETCLGKVEHSKVPDYSIFHQRLERDHLAGDDDMTRGDVSSFCELLLSPLG